MKINIDCKDIIYKLQNGSKLNKTQFINYFENKVFKTIRKYKLFEIEDKISVAVSGGKDSISVLYLTWKYLKKKNLEKNLIAIAIDEGIKNYRAKTLKTLKKFCENYKITLIIKSYKEIFGTSQDENVKTLKEKNKNISPCNICGTFRRNALNLLARENFSTKLVTGHNLDDESQNILLNIFKNNFKILAKLGPKTGILKSEKFVQRIKPLYFCTEKEVRLYTIVKNFEIEFSVCPYSKEQFRENISNIINELEDKHLGVKNSIINFYLEIQSILREKYLKESENFISLCSICSEPSQKKICNVCLMKKEVEKK